MRRQAFRPWWFAWQGGTALVVLSACLIANISGGSALAESGEGNSTSTKHTQYLAQGITLEEMPESEETEESGKGEGQKQVEEAKKSEKPDPFNYPGLILHRFHVSDTDPDAAAD